MTRRLTHRLGQVMDRLHILEGYLVAYLNIEEIHVIREEDEPNKKLWFDLDSTKSSERHS